MPTPTIIKAEEQFFNVIYEGNGGGQRVGKFVPFDDNGTIAKSCIFNKGDSPRLNRTPSGTGTSRRKYTLSVWAKPSLSSSASDERYVIDAGPYGNSDGITFDDDRTLKFWMNGRSNADFKTNRTFEDTSKFYHILVSVDTTQSTASDRVKIYVDGDQITSFSLETYPSQNYDGNWGSTASTNIGSSNSPNRYYNGNLAEVNYVDGSALTPSTFGLTDTSTGRWIPKTLSGITYGTNGFRLTFADSSALGDDTSGNTNDFTATNLATTDQTTDSPTQNHCTWDPNDSANLAAFSEGNLKVTGGSASTSGSCRGTLAPKSGKYYFEIKFLGGAFSGHNSLGIRNKNVAINSTTSGSGVTTESYHWRDDGYAINGTLGQMNSGFSSYTTNDYIGVAMDLDAGKVWMSKNGTYEKSGNPVTGANPMFTIPTGQPYAPWWLGYGYTNNNELNCGQKAFNTDPPTGFLALQQDNLPETDKGITGLTWMKDRDTDRNHVLFDSSRGAGKALLPSATNQEIVSDDTLYKFLKGGFTYGEDTTGNTAGKSYVSWSWVANGGTTATNNDGSITSTVQVNTTAGFSIVRWTGGGSAGTVGHGLSQKPEWMFYKRTNASGDGWITYHKDQDASPASGSMQIQSDITFGADSTLWNNTEPTSSVISIGTYGMQSGEERTAWVWHSVDGFSKFGKYIGNGSADGPFVYLGFRPAYVVIKRLTAGYHWTAKDTVRDPINPMTRDLKWNLTAAESVDANNAVDFLSNGFKIRTGSSGGTNYNGSGATHIYMAWAEHPFVGDGTSPVTAR